MEQIIEIWETYQKIIMLIIFIIFIYQLYKIIQREDNTNEIKQIENKIKENHSIVVKQIEVNHKKIEDKLKENEKALKQLNDNTDLDKLEELLEVILEEKIKGVEDTLSSRLTLSLHSIMERLFKENNISEVVKDLLDKHLGTQLEERLKEHTKRDNTSNSKGHNQSMNKSRFD